MIFFLCTLITFLFVTLACTGTVPGIKKRSRNKFLEPKLHFYKYFAILLSERRMPGWIKNLNILPLRNISFGTCTGITFIVQYHTESLCCQKIIPHFFSGNIGLEPDPKKEKCGAEPKLNAFISWILTASKNELYSTFEHVNALWSSYFVYHY